MESQKDARIGRRAVHIVSGYTGEIFKLHSWGVSVFVKERLSEKENWPWSTITFRRPRLVRRFPRPFRYPRTKPSKICHCKSGRVEVRGREIRCTKCKFAIGTESFPRRIRWAEKLFRRAYPEGYKPRTKKKTQKRVHPAGTGKTRSRGQGQDKKARLDHRGVEQVHGGSHGKAAKAVSTHEHQKVSKAPNQAVPKTGKARVSVRRQRGAAAIPQAD